MSRLKTRVLLAATLTMLFFAGSNGLVSADLEMFLLKDVSGQYYTFNQNEVNNSYIAYQMEPALAAANMYRQFDAIIKTGGSVVGLKDSSKGYLDYAAASSASLMAQINQIAFNINAYLASDAAKKLDAVVTNEKIVDSQGNVAGSPGIVFGNWLLVSNELTDSTSTQSTGTLNAEMAAMTTTATEGLSDQAFRVNPSLPADPGADTLPVNPSSSFDFSTSSLNDSRVFSAYNYKTSTYSDSVNARLAYSGTHVNVWVDQSNPKVVVTDAMAAQMGAEFDESIYSLIRDNYYTESDVNGDGKVAILCYDIQDNYAGSGTSYTGGYFASNDLTGTSYSNQMELIYADTWPTMGTDPANPDVSAVYSTLAHEFQHMVNANRNLLEEKSSMDTWLNEALSLSAEGLYEGAQTNRIDYYNKSAAVKNGRSLLNWKSGDEVLANYALSYLFAEYLSAQAEAALGTGSPVKIFREIIMDQSGSYTAVENVVRKHIDQQLSFGRLMTNFRVALLRKDDSGVYGFGGQSAFDALETPLYTGGSKTLEGGGAVVKALSRPFTKPGNGGAAVTYTGVLKP